MKLINILAQIILSLKNFKFKLQSGDEYYLTDLVDEFFVDNINELETALNGLSTSYVVDAKTLALAAMIIYFSFKSYGLMTGDERIDIIPLIRPFAFMLIVSHWLLFLGIIKSPIKRLENKGQFKYKQQISLTNSAARERSIAMTKFVKAYFEEEVESKPPTFSGNPLDFVMGQISSYVDTIENFQEIIAKQAMLMYAKVKYYLYVFWMNILVLIFQAAFWLLFYVKIIMSNLLEIIGPLTFALSIIPAFKESYIKWIAKYISVNLYVFFAYLAGTIALVQIRIGLEKDKDTYLNLISEKDKLLTYALTEGVSVNYYGVSLIVGIAGFFCVPIVAHWIVGFGSTGSVANKGIAAAKQTASAIQKVGSKIYNG